MKFTQIPAKELMTDVENSDGARVTNSALSSAQSRQSKFGVAIIMIGAFMGTICFALLNFPSRLTEAPKTQDTVGLFQKNVNLEAQFNSSTIYSDMGISWLFDFEIVKSQGTIMKKDGTERKEQCGSAFEVLTPLKDTYNMGELRTWCESAWPDEGSVYSSKERAGNACPSGNYFVDNSLMSQLVKKHESGLGLEVEIPRGDDVVRYRITSTLSGGQMNGGVYKLEKVLLPAQKFTDLPYELVLKVPESQALDPKIYKVKERTTELNCLRAAAGLHGVNQLYGDKFKVPAMGASSGCYQGFVLELLKGKPWKELMSQETSSKYLGKAMDKGSECALQEQAGRMLCGLMRRGIANVDVNNPGNWIALYGALQHEKWVSLDLGACYQQQAGNALHDMMMGVSTITDSSTDQQILDAVSGTMLEESVTEWALSNYAQTRIDMKEKAVLARETLAMNIEDIMWDIPWFARIGPYMSLRSLILKSQARIEDTPPVPL